MIERNKYVLLLFLSMFISFLMHFDKFDYEIQGIHSWRQCQTMWNVRNFVREDSNILNPRVSSYNGGKDNIYRYEFPVMQWPIAMVQKVFGEHISIVRVYLFLIGLVSIYFFFLLLQVIGISKLASLFGAIFFQFSPVFYLYTINPIPDTLALCGGIVYLFYIFSYFKNPKSNVLIMASIGLLLATLAKLPFLMFSIVSIVYFIRNLYLNKKLDRNLWVFMITQAIFLMPAFFWYKWVMPSWEGNGILSGIFDNQITIGETIRILKYHIGIMFPYILLSPTSWILFGFGMVGIVKNLSFLAIKSSYIFGLIGITFLYLALQFNMINSVHDYYMLPFLPWMYIIVALGIERIHKMEYPTRKIGIIGLVILAPIAAWWLNRDSWSIEKTFFNPDVIIHQEKLKSLVPQDELCIILNDNSSYIFSYLIDKKGHIFKKDHLPILWIKDMILHYNVHYMYSDSRKVDEDPDFEPLVDKLLFQAGTVKVFKLKDKLKL